MESLTQLVHGGNLVLSCKGVSSNAHMGCLMATQYDQSILVIELIRYEEDNHSPLINQSHSPLINQSHSQARNYATIDCIQGHTHSIKNHMSGNPHMLIKEHPTLIISSLSLGVDCSVMGT